MGWWWDCFRFLGLCDVLRWFRFGGVVVFGFWVLEWVGFWGKHD